jgi:hypothetical protein
MTLRAFARSLLNSLPRRLLYEMFISPVVHWVSRRGPKISSGFIASFSRMIMAEPCMI